MDLSGGFYFQNYCLPVVDVVLVVLCILERLSSHPFGASESPDVDSESQCEHCACQPFTPRQKENEKCASEDAESDTEDSNEPPVSGQPSPLDGSFLTTIEEPVKPFDRFLVSFDVSLLSSVV